MDSQNKKEFGVNFNRTKYDSDMEAVVFEWIEGVMQQPGIFSGVKGPDQLKEKLKDGIILCDLMNKLTEKEENYIKYNKSPKLPFQKMENIEFFNEKMKNYPGMRAEYVFVTQDLFNGKNLAGVLIGLRELGTQATIKGVKPAINELRFSK